MSHSTNPVQRTAARLAAELCSGALDAVELTERTLAGIASHADQAVFIEALAKRALREAEAARKRLKEGRPLSALDGVPVAWKDLFDVEGRVTTAGSVVLKGNPTAPRDAALLEAGVRAGLVTIGVTNMTEFAYSGIGINPHYGTPRNPRDAVVARSPGGSSSGAAAAVAAGLVPIAIGTDTGGSIRIPAAFNGIVGYKTSTGHFPMTGVFPLSRTLDTLGPLAQTVEDCVLTDMVLRGAAAPAARRGSVDRLTILVPETLVLEACEPEVLANFEASLARLAKAGARIMRVPMPQLAAIPELIGKHGHLLAAEALQVHHGRIHGADAARMDPRVLKRIQLATQMSALDLVEVQQARARLIAEANAAVGEAIVAFPAAPHVAMPLAPLLADDDAFFRANAKTLRNTMVGNFLDWCGVALPNGIGAGGMPTSLLLSAIHGRDTAVLSAALSIEPLLAG
jgi:aspartyl-tRNA(Asn)/glutamyl-tRNA(Gln) amidotransferase subunit A